MKQSNLFIFILAISIALSSCKTLMSYTNILNCDFKMKSLTNTQLGGIDIQNIKNYSELGFIQLGTLTKAYLSGSINLEFQLDLECKNPNPSEASMAKFDWIISIDDIQMATGTNSQEYKIPPNDGTQIIPLNISINLLDILNDQTKNALLNFGLNLADNSNKPSRVGLKIKPTIYLNGIPITYPGYIDLGTEYGGTH